MSAHPSHPVLRYHGGKWKLAPWIVSHFPHHRTYVEVFGGGAGVLLRKTPSSVEVYNDLDEQVVNFFRILRERPQELAQAVALTPYARSELERAWEPTNDPLESARRFAIRSWLSIGGPTTRWKTGFRFRRRGAHSLLNQWNELPENIMITAKRLKEIIIEHSDYRRILQRYDAPDTLFYCDPPYLPATRSKWGKAAYRFEFTEEDHEDMAQALRTVQGMVILSGYEHPLYRDLFHDWTSFAQPVVNQNGRVVTEYLWLSPRASQALEESDLPLWRLITQREG